MFSNVTEEKIELAIVAETHNACDKWGDNYNSLHEGYAVLKEEVEETDEEMQIVNLRLQWFWDSIRRNEPSKKSIEVLREHAEKLALEAVQVAAVCNKILNGL